MVRYIHAPDLEERVRKIISILKLTYIDGERIKCVRSHGSRSVNTFARIHGISKAFLTGLKMKPHYVIEFISERFDNLPEDEKDKIIIHELLHIPKTFSGSLLSHKRGRIDREVKILFKILKQDNYR
ncbi:MAG: putative metallopeptidase [Aigarchaeota archaeon]|nr:putative metallopeptidase [Aigarchaeota archaeon]MDW7986149.1 putative metallopeptidase [Nitrososphaerota archaeon]